jgi:6-phosphogluconolactonase
MTLTLPVINAAAMVVFLVQGDAKAEILRRVLETQAPDSPFPAGRVLPETGKLVWLVDQAAASLLKV